MKANNSNPADVRSVPPAEETGAAEQVSVAPALVPRWLALSIFVLALLVAAGVRFRLLDFPLERDEGEYAYAGQLIQEGIPPYQLAYNMKMPGVYLAYAGIMSFFGQSAGAIHLGLMLVNAATMVVLLLIARRFLDISGAVIAAGAYGLMTLSPAYLGLAAHATHFVVLAALLGIWLLFRMENGGKLPVCLAAGVLFGVAFLMKQQGMFLGIFGGLYLAWMSLAGKLPWVRIWPRLAWYALGCVLPFLAVCLWLKVAGVFPAFWFWTFSYAREYVGVLTFHDGVLYAKDTLKSIFQAAPLLWVAAGAGFLCLLLTRQSWNTRIFFGGFFIFSLLAVCPGYYFREHYFIVLVPAVALLVGLAVAWSGRWLAKIGSSPLLGALPFVLGVAACAQSLYGDRAIFFSLSPAQVCRAVYPANPFPESSAVARYLEDHTLKDQPILVLGSEPQIYFYSHRHSSTGYIYSYPLMQPQAFARDMQENMIREIQRRPPAYLVLVSLATSWGEYSGSSHRLIDWTADYLNQNMEQVGLIQKFETGTPEAIWGPAAATAPLTSDWYIAVFKRVEAGASSDRAQAIARDKNLMDRFDDSARQEEFGFYQAALKLKPNDVGVREQFALALLKRGRTGEADSEYRTILRLNPDDFDAHANLGLILSNQGRVEEATQEYREAIRLKPNEFIVHDNLGNLLLRSGGIDDAMNQFREALRIQPDYAKGHDDLGVVLALQGKNSEAISEFREALRLKPEMANAHDYLGAVLALQGQNDEAILELKEALRLNPGLVKAHDHLGMALASEGRTEEAIQQFQEALQLNPNDAMARDNLVKVETTKSHSAVGNFAPAKP